MRACARAHSAGKGSLPGAFSESVEILPVVEKDMLDLANLKCFLSFYLCQFWSMLPRDFVSTKKKS